MANTILSQTCTCLFSGVLWIFHNLYIIITLNKLPLVPGFNSELYTNQKCIQHPGAKFVTEFVTHTTTQTHAGSCRGTQSFSKDFRYFNFWSELHYILPTELPSPLHHHPLEWCIMLSHLAPADPPAAAVLAAAGGNIYYDNFSYYDSRFSICCCCHFATAAAATINNNNPFRESGWGKGGGGAFCVCLCCDAFPNPPSPRLPSLPCVCFMNVFPSLWVCVCVCAGSINSSFFLKLHPSGTACSNPPPLFQPKRNMNMKWKGVGGGSSQEGWWIGIMLLKAAGSKSSAFHVCNFARNCLCARRTHTHTQTRTQPASETLFLITLLYK